MDDWLPALRTLAVTCAGAKEGERALIVTDSAADEAIVGALTGVLGSLALDVNVASSAPAELPGAEPPAEVGAAMLEADVIFELTSVFVGSCASRQKACAKGARYCSAPGLTARTLRPAGPFSADFRALGEKARRLAERFDEATEFHLTSDAGTDLRGSFAGRKGRPLWGIADQPGDYAAPPDVELGASPVEGSAEGIVIVDGSLLFLGPDQLPSVVELRFEAGRLTAIHGKEGGRLQRAIELSGDERMRTLAELSIGLNPFSRPGGSALELEGIVGGAHIAVGNNIAYGGSNDARSHIDCVLLSATLSLDGVAIDAR